MAEQYLVISSGTLLSQEQLNGLGADSWILEHVIEPEDGLTWYHIFRKTTP